MALSRRTARDLCVLSAASAFAGCELPTGYACTANVVPAVVVEIRDARDGSALALGARGVVRDGAFVDSLTPYESASASQTDLYSRQAAYERTGTYAVEVQHDGYRPWTTTGVRVTKNTCHVNTVRVQARLEPAG